MLDWVVPPEWNVREAWLEAPDGTRFADVAEHPLHLLGYSSPIEATVSLDELREHLFTVPTQPDVIPYRTSYYRENWGFCLPHREAEALRPGTYRVHVDTSLEPGSLSYGELVVPGTPSEPGSTPDEVLVSTHICHPAMANDNATGMAMAAVLARHVAATPHRFTYRFVFVPGTIGAISWLAGHRDVVGRIRHGVVLTGLGDTSRPTWKRSRRGNAEVDEVMEFVLAETGREYRVDDFSPYGYDERQYCSPGFDLPVGRFGRGQHGEYPEYHTSADDLDFVDEPSLDESWRLLRRFVEVLEANRTYRNLQPYGEPQLGRRGLYRSIGSTMDPKAAEMGLLWVLSLADGSRSALDISHRSGLPFDAVQAACRSLLDADLLAAD